MLSREKIAGWPGRLMRHTLRRGRRLCCSETLYERVKMRFNVESARTDALGSVSRCKAAVGCAVWR